MTDRERRPAAFIDRDGTLIVEHDFLSDPDGVHLIPGAAEALRRLRDAGYAIALITNQSGIARGYFTVADFEAVQARLDEMLAAEGVELDGEWYCPHHPDFTGPCECRKPGLLLFREAADTLHLDTGRSIFIGDRVRDIAPAADFGGIPVLVRTGYGDRPEAELPAGTVVASDLLDAVERVLRHRDMVDSTGGHG